MNHTSVRRDGAEAWLNLAERIKRTLQYVHHHDHCNDWCRRRYMRHQVLVCDAGQHHGIRYRRRRILSSTHPYTQGLLKSHSAPRCAMRNVWHRFPEEIHLTYCITTAAVQSRCEFAKDRCSRIVCQALQNLHTGQLRACHKFALLMVGLPNEAPSNTILMEGDRLKKSTSSIKLR